MDDGVATECKKPMTNKHSSSRDDLRETGERKPILKEKSVMRAADKGTFHQHQEATVVASDMAEEMQEFVIQCAVEALSRDMFINEKVMASYIRTNMEEKYTPTWHCIVGGTFASYVSHECKHYLYFSVGSMGILVFKCG